MNQGSGKRKSEKPAAANQPPAPKFLVQLEPWHRNLSSLLKTEALQPLPTASTPGEFWPDVFVSSGLPWRRFAESALYHALVIAALWGTVQLLGSRLRPAPVSAFDRSEVIYYQASEYLPPLNSRRHISYHAQKGEPAFAKQEIISVPADPDNSRQTIVTPPKVRINHEVPLPNIVAWNPTSVEVPMAATARSAAQMKLPQLPTDVVAPPPEVSSDPRRPVAELQTNVVAPPPTVAMATIRHSDIDIGHSAVVGPAPKLPMDEQHRIAGFGGRGLAGTPNVVPPPPSAGGAGTRRGGGQLIALSVNPAVALASTPSGNRRGTFAASPKGKPGAPGTPDVSAGTGEGGSGGGSGNAPAGLYVAPAPVTSSVAGNGSHSYKAGTGDNDSRLLASATPPARVTSAHEVSSDKVTDEERQVFGDRKFYAMTLNMPNLNSAGGSWVIHFAEMKDDAQKGDLSAPVAMRKVDPPYPAELMRQNVSGVVTLYAVIHRDGSVDGIRVLNSADDRLNEYARSALARWRFYPATRNGNAVDLDAVVSIPFRPSHLKNGF